MSTRADEQYLDKEPLLRDYRLGLMLHNISNTIVVNETMDDGDEQFYMDSIDLDYNGNLKFKRGSSGKQSEHQEISSSLSHEIKNNLLGVFVVAFDTRHGNTIEWQAPKNLNLDQVEFKAMASGFHLMQRDLVYFTKDGMYGLAAFESLKIDNSDERNIRMKSVGIMAKSFSFLKKFSNYLKNQVRYQLEKPSNNYDDLRSLWTNKSIKNIADFLEDQQASKNVLFSSSNQSSMMEKMFNKRSFMYKQISSVNLSDFYRCTKFALMFGPSLFCLWKYVLLNKRIMFYDSPPINDLCSRVMCSFYMLGTSNTHLASKQLIKPLFNVAVNDIEQLKNEPFYIACSSERIYESKRFLYDLYVNGTLMDAVLADSQKSLLKINSADKKRFDLLLNKISELMAKHSNKMSWMNSQDEDEPIFINFFIEQNDKIFGILEDLEYEEPRSEKVSVDNKEGYSLTSLPSKERKVKRNETNYVNKSHMKKMGLDPSDDRDFLNELIRFYDFNLILI